MSFFKIKNLSLKVSSKMPEPLRFGVFQRVRRRPFKCFARFFHPIKVRQPIGRKIIYRVPPTHERIRRIFVLGGLEL
jgi:hypothetical protein